MAKTLSKAKFKPKVLELLREVERTGEELVITDRGRPVVRIVAYESDHSHLLASLRGSVVEYIDPTVPVGEGDWEVLRDPA